MPGEPPAQAGDPPDPADLPEGGFGWHLIRSLRTALPIALRGRRIGWNSFCR